MSYLLLLDLASLYLHYFYVSKVSQVFNIKNVSSYLSHKKTSVFLSLRLSFRKFKKILPNTFIYESILIKIYMNTNIMNAQIFYFDNYDLKGHWRSQKPCYNQNDWADNRHFKILSFHSRSVKMNFKVRQFLQYVHLKPIRTGVFGSLTLINNSRKG